MTTTYRKPIAKDLPAILGLMPGLYSDMGEGLAKVLSEFLADNNYYKQLAIDKDNGQVVGFMVGTCRLEVDFECRAGIIEEIVVRKDRQGQGLGKEMLADFSRWAAAKGAKGVLVPCGREGFYEKLGFETFTVKRYWKEI